MGPLRPGRTLVYSGDTRPCESILKASWDADLLIHDCSFSDEMADWAEESRHSTAGEVAALAKEAGVRRLVLTHISSRYTDDVEPILDDSKKIFKDVIVAEDLMEIEIPNRPE
jgi:ribonuclease Z